MGHQSNASEGWQLEGSSAEAYERYLASAFSPWAKELVSLADVREGERVLDVACGTGIVARNAAPRVGRRGKVVGIDLNDDMLRVAAAASASSEPPIEWRAGNALELPFPAEAFDAVFCEQAIPFFSDPVKALSEMRRVLSSSGRAAVSVCRSTAFCPTYEVMASALERYVSREAGATMRSPFCRWRLAELRGLFADAGFDDVRVTIEFASLRYPSVEEFLRREAASSPLAGPIGALNESVRHELVKHLESALADHVDDEGVLCPIEAYVALGRISPP